MVWLPHCQTMPGANSGHLHGNKDGVKLSVHDCVIGVLKPMHCISLKHDLICHTHNSSDLAYEIRKRIFVGIGGAHQAAPASASLCAAFGGRHWLEGKLGRAARGRGQGLARGGWLDEWVGGCRGQGSQRCAFEATHPRSEGFHRKGRTATVPECCPYQARSDTKAEAQPPPLPMSDLAPHTAQPCSCTASAAAALPAGPMLGQEHQRAGSPSLEPPSVPLQGYLN